MRWVNLKRHPTNELGPYFAEIEDGVLDFSNDLIADIVEDIGDLVTTWPKASLLDLKKLTEELRQKVAIPSGEVIQLGTVTYLHQEPDKKKPTETGLTWDNAEIRPNSSNFVVETVEATLNDEQTRLSITSYAEIQNAFEEFLAGAENLAEFDTGELPIIPDNEDYRTALEKNELLKILPSKATVKTVTPNVPTSAAVNPAASNIGTPGLPVAPVAPVKQVVSNESGSPQAKAATNSTPSNKGPRVKKPSATPVKAQTNSVTPQASTMTRLVNSFVVEAPQFPIDKQIKFSDVNPDNSHYVEIMMAKETEEANSFLSLSATQFTSTIHAKLVRVVSQINLETTPDEFVGTDWQDRLKNESATKIRAEFSEREKNDLAEIEAAHAAAIATENRRHEDALKDLDAKLVSDKKLTHQKNVSAMEERIQAKTADLISEQEVYIKTEVKQLNESLTRSTEQQIALQGTTYLNKAVEQLAGGFKQLKSQLAEKRDEYTNIHEAAVQKAERRDLQEQETLAKKVEHAGMLDLQQQNVALTEKNTQLSDHARKLDQQIADLGVQNKKIIGEYEALKTDYESFNRKVMDQKTSDQLANISDAIGSNNVSQNQNSKPHSFLKGMLTSAAVLLAVGGATYEVIHVNQVEAKSDKAVSAAKAAESSYNHKSSSVVLSSTTASKGSSSSTTTSTSASSSDFSTLDEDIANKSLKVYYQSFYNHDLETTSRVLLVGKRLIDSGNISDAKLLAQANPDHSSELWMAIGQAQAGE